MPNRSGAARAAPVFLVTPSNPQHMQAPPNRFEPNLAIPKTLTTLAPEARPIQQKHPNLQDREN